MLRRLRRIRSIQRVNRYASRFGMNWDWWIWPTALLIVGLCCLTYVTPAVRIASELISQNPYLALIDGMLNPFRNRHSLLNSGLPVYDLKIRRQEYVVLEQVAEEARKYGWMNDELKQWARAQFIHDGTSYNVKVRLRGDLSPHWKGPKKSYRIKFGRSVIDDEGELREEQIFFQGRRQINLIIPSDKKYALGPFVNSVMADYGLVVPRDRFVVLRINGVVHGLYYETEHFDKPLLAAHRRPETPVFGQNNRALRYEHHTKLGRPGPTDANLDLGSMRRQVESASELGMQAMDVLIEHSLDPSEENFRRARAVLDWDKYLRFRSITTLCNTNHIRFASDNLKLYYDPSRGLLEPIPWDVLLVKMPREPGTIDFFNEHGTDAIQHATLRDPALRLERNRMLWELVADGGEDLMSRYDEIHHRIRPMVWADVLTTPVQGHKMDSVRDELAFNVKRVHKVLQYSSANLNYRLESPERASLELAVLNFGGVRIDSLSFEDSSVLDGEYRLYEDADDDGELSPGDPMVAECLATQGRASFALDRTFFPKVEYGSETMDGRYWEFYDALTGRSRFFVVGTLAPESRHPLQWQPPTIEVAAFNAVTDERVPTTVLDGIAAIPDDGLAITLFDASRSWDLDALERSLAEFVTDHPQFRSSPTVPGAVELAGDVSISETVVVPRAIPLVIRPGTDITLAPSASLVCFGGLQSVGTVARPIRIHGDGSGQPWGTFAVVRPEEEVVVHHTEFRDGGQAIVNGILFTGGLAVHDGDLDLRHSRFFDMQSEDAINVKNGHVMMVDCVVQRSASDAIDIDVGTGAVRGSRFLDIAGDGLDISYSTVELAGNHIENVVDKGISVGEQSTPVILNNFISHCGIGISTKDLSFARVAHCTFRDNRTAIEAKRKKPMFGAGGGEFVNCVFAGNETLLSEDYFSRGHVEIESCVLDEDVDLAGCTSAEIRFVNPESGDFALAPGVGDGLELATRDWLPSDLASRPPGVLARPVELSAMRADRSGGVFVAQGPSTPK